MKIAVIGAGISGLVVAYRLCSEHDITVFEANDYPGGHTNTVDVELDGERHAVDTGFIVFNDWTYPNFIALLDELSVASQPTSMSFSVSDELSGLEYNGHKLNTLFAQRRNLLNPKFYRLVLDILRFNREAQRVIAETDEDETVGDFLSRYKFSREFAQYYLLPMGSAIWSCPTGTFAHFPIHFIAEFYKNHGLLSVRRRPIWRVIRGGSKKYIEGMTRGFRERILLRTPVMCVRRFADQVIVQPRHKKAEAFDHVIFACHSDQALRILGDDARPAEREVLAAFPYQRNVAVLHTDISLLPRNRRAWASWNYRVSATESSASANVTYNMNLLQGIRSRHTYCVTLNDETRIAPQHTLGRFEYHHPVFNTQRTHAQRRHPDLINQNRTSFCGAYWRNGFHEDGVVSALKVVDAISKEHPQQRSPAGQLAGVTS
jgi:predicted NAD/FAD-binding protein